MIDPANAAAAAVPPSRGAPATAGNRLPRARRRVPIWDNARWVCIALVVLGHALQDRFDSDAALALYIVIYAFHMPAFALISGYFSKSSSPNRPQMARLITDIVVPYVIFEGLWILMDWVFEGRLN